MVVLAALAIVIVFLLRSLTGGGGGVGGTTHRNFESGENRLEADFARKVELQRELDSQKNTPSQRKVIESELRRTQLRIDAACEDVLSMGRSSLDTKNPLAMQEALARIRRVSGGASPALKASMEACASQLTDALRH